LQALEGKVLEPVLRQGREPGPVRVLGPVLRRGREAEPVRVPALEPAWLLLREPGQE
tara:strand:- start:5750 stop:5920 length:171 start_codon:yes stop_codon:yes gene_type:complete